MQRKKSGGNICAEVYGRIAGTLLIGGSTFNSLTNASQDPTPGMVLSIERNREKCKKIMKTNVFVFDDSIQKHRYYADNLDFLLR